MQEGFAPIGPSVLGLAIALALVTAGFAIGAPTANATSSRCNITVRTLRGEFSGTVTRKMGTPCPVARELAETSLLAIIRAGSVRRGEFSTRAYSRVTGRWYRARCAAKGNLYSPRGITVDCRASISAGKTAVRVLYLADAELALTPHYLDYAQEPLEKYTHIGPEGVPLFNIGGQWVEHPDGVAQWGLREYAYAHRRPLMTAARWFADHQQPDGGFAYLFDVDADGVPMLSPWISALAQGQAISVLVRAYQLTGSPGYLRAARRALNPFLHPVPTGLTSWWGGHHWYEEYPAAHPEHVLNGFMFALVGLHDLAPRSLTAWRLWRAGVRGLIAHLQSYDLPEQRTMLYAAVGAGRYVAPPYYRQIDAVLIRTIARWTHKPLLHVYARRWTDYTG